MKLQDAYFAETNNLGNWSKIGYKMASSTNFTYGGDAVTPKTTCAEGSKLKDDKCVLSSDDTKDGAVAGASITDGWTAKNNVNLNDCAADVNWKISAETVDPQSASGDNKATGASITYSSEALSDGCAALTPKFTEIAPVASSSK